MTSDDPSTGAQVESKQNPSFRHQLRRDTTAEHEAAEAHFHSFLTAPLTHLHAFIGAQRMGLAALRASLGMRSGEVRERLDVLIDRLDGDCETYGIMPARIDAPKVLDPVSVDYLVLGSRLGTEVIHRKLSAQGLSDLPRYFTEHDDPSPWRSLCDRLDAMSSDSFEARRLIQDVRTGYVIFHRAAECAGFEARGAA